MVPTAFVFLVVISATGVWASPDARVIVEDDFEGPGLDGTRWDVQVDGAPASFVRLEDGAVHLLGMGAGCALTSRAEVPPFHVLEFDYLQPAGERVGGYANCISCQVTHKAAEQEWDGAVWYVEYSGGAWSHHGGRWDCRRSGARLAPEDDRWYHVTVSCQDTTAVIIVAERDTGRICWRAAFPHDPMVRGRIRFDAAAVGPDSRWGFMLDNVSIRAREAELEPVCRPLGARATAHDVPGAWRPIEIAGRGFWHLAEYRPDEWHEWGMAGHPVFADAAWLFAPNDRALMAGERRPFILEPSLDPRIQRVQRRIVASAGDRFLGFYGMKLGAGGPLNEWGDGLIRTDMRDWFGGPIRDRYEGLERLRQRYEELADTTPVKRAVMALDGYRFFHHHAFAWGASSVMAEIGENIPCTNLQIAFARGAGREFGKPWGIDISSWFAGTVTDYSYTPDLLEADAAMFSGHSPMLHKRFCYASWLAGANTLWFENYRLLVMRESSLRQLAGFETSGQPEKWRWSPVGEIAERLFRLDREKDRGTPYTPVAVIVDFAHGWSPRGCAPHRIWGRLPLSDGDRMMDHFFNLVYPWHEPGTGWEPEDTGVGLESLERGYLTETPYGDIFDGLTTATCRTLRNYPVAILVGDVRIDDALSRRLAEYVQAGGTLVVNARQAGSALPSSLTGAVLTGEVRRATEALCHLDGSTMRSAEFDYAVAELRGARPVVTVPGSNEALVCDHRVGDGHVVLTTPNYLLDRNQEPLELMDHVLRHVTSGLVPIRVSPGVQWMVNRSPDGWVVGLFNHRGAYKQPRGMPWIREEETAVVLVELAEPAASVEEWVAGAPVDVRAEARVTSVRLSVPPGDVRILHVRRQSEARR